MIITEKTQNLLYFPHRSKTEIVLYSGLISESLRFEKIINLSPRKNNPLLVFLVILEYGNEKSIKWKHLKQST